MIPHYGLSAMGMSGRLSDYNFQQLSHMARQSPDNICPDCGVFITHKRNMGRHRKLHKKPDDSQGGQVTPH